MASITFSGGEAVEFEEMSAVAAAEFIDRWSSVWLKENPKPTAPTKETRIAANKPAVMMADSTDKGYLAEVKAWEGQQNSSLGMALLRYVASFAVLTDDQRKKVEKERARRAASGLDDPSTDEQLFVLSIAAKKLNSDDVNALMAVAGVDNLEAEVAKN